MNVVISKYTYQWISTRGDHLIYCSRTNSYLKVTPELYEFINDCRNNSELLSEIDSELLAILQNHKIVVSEYDDDDYILERQFKEDQCTFSPSTIGLVLVPTTSCNFDCPYCFEEGKKPSNMSDETIEALISFLKLHKLAKNIALTWYGGEPLLAFGTIKKILNKIESETGLPIIDQSIITNGYYFSDNVIEFFKQHPLSNIQITLDGNKARHDTIRKQKGTGVGSYDRLINNIDNILNKLPDTQVSIRVNIDKANKDEFFDVYARLSERWKNKKIKIYPGILRIDNETKTNLACSVLSQSEAMELYYDLRQKQMIDGSIYPTLQHHEGCCATVVNSYIIGPDGEIYKCWNDVSNSDRIVGNIREQKIRNTSLFYRYIIASKTCRNKACLDCSMLPICSGSCAYYRLRNIYEKGEYALCQCLQKEPEMLEKSLESYYYGHYSKSE